MISKLCNAAFGLPVAAVALAISQAYAAPVLGPSDGWFYTLPASLNGQHGDLIQYRPATVKLGDGAPAFAAWNVLYQSTDSNDVANAVSGTVLVPQTPWQGGTPRPVILYAVANQGMAHRCAPSRQFEIGTDYENANIRAALKAGYAVLVSDYAGYLQGAKPTYLAGRSQANAILDLFTAATALPEAGISASAQVGIWGYSQGGQTAAWATQVFPDYAPKVKVVGVAAGSVPADFLTTAKLLDGNLGGGIMARSIGGLSNEDPESIGIGFMVVGSEAGQAELGKLESECLFETLLSLQNRSLASFTISPKSPLEQLLGLPLIKDSLLAQNVAGHKSAVPIYQYHGRADEFIPLGQDITLRNAYCAAGSTVYFDVYPSEQIVTQFQAAPHVLSWMKARFAGTPAPSTCGNTAPTPAANNVNPTGGGDFLMLQDKWPLTASVTLKTLNQTVNLPSASTFTATTNLTKKTLQGSMAVPDFKTTIKLLGVLPAQIGMKVTPVGDTTGLASLDEAGQLHVHGVAYADLTLTSMVGIPIGECKTSTPVAFKLDYDGPVSALGTGLNFSGTTSFPPLKGCILASILSALMAGPGQTYSFTVNPPAPVKH